MRTKEIKAVFERQTYLTSRPENTLVALTGATFLPIDNKGLNNMVRVGGTINDEALDKLNESLPENYTINIVKGKRR